MTVAFIPACAINRSESKVANTLSAITEGAVLKAQIIAGPFDLHRRYRSMEGPFVLELFEIADLIDTKVLVLPETSIQFLEGSGGKQGANLTGPSGSNSANQSNGPSMGGALNKVSMSGPPAAPSKANSATHGHVPFPFIRPDNDASTRLKHEKELYWFKGMQVEVLDEQDKPMTGSEFMCHVNLNVSPRERNERFPASEPVRADRLVTITQGQLQFRFPSGFGVPVASDEHWNIALQAINRTTDEHRRVKLRCTLFFLKDSALVYPIKALQWSIPDVWVVTDGDTKSAAEKQKHQFPGCLSSSAGVIAPNSVPDALFRDKSGRMLSEHWVVPPGTHRYVSPVADRRMGDKDRRIYAVWTHIHPLCTNASLVECGAGTKRKVLSIAAKTDTRGGLEIKHIDLLASASGIPLAKGKQYEVEATYENTTGKPVDSMVFLGVF